MRGIAHLFLLLSAAMMAFVPGLANAQPAPAAKQDAQMTLCHEGADMPPADTGKQKPFCLSLCLAGHGAVMPASLHSEPPHTPLPYLEHASLAPVLVSAVAGLDPPPPRRS